MPVTQTNRQTQTNKKKIAERENGVKEKCTINDDSKLIKKSIDW